MQKYNVQKKTLKETKLLQDIITLVTNLKFQHKPKYQPFKNPHIKIDLWPRGQNSLRYNLNPIEFEWKSIKLNWIELNWIEFEFV
jgi:hypothetical protein